MSELIQSVYSDLHLARKNLDINFMCNNLYNSILDDILTYKINMLVLAGDVYDRILTVPSLEAQEIDIVIIKILKLCKKYNVAIRLVEGTPSHDWRQVARFVMINNNCNINADLKYFNQVTIDYDERFNIYMLYVPDEAHPTANETLLLVKQLLIENNITEVDYAIMHGAFDYQLPNTPMLADILHSTDEYSKIVKHKAYIGHVHITKPKGKIIPPGSFERMQHGEEEKKGHYIVSTKKNKVTVKFIENKKALKFITISLLPKWGLEECVSFIEDKLVELNIPVGSHIRITASKDADIFTSWLRLLDSFNGYTITKKTNHVILNQVTEEVKMQQGIEINKDNIINLVTKQLNVKGINLVDEHIHELRNFI